MFRVLTFRGCYVSELLPLGVLAMGCSYIQVFLLQKVSLFRGFNIKWFLAKEPFDVKAFECRNP